MAATTATPSTRLIPPADLYAFQRLLTLRETEDESQKGRLEHAFGVASSPSTEILDEAIAAYLLRHPEALQIIKEVEAFEADPSDYIPAVPVWKLEDHFSFHPTDNISHLRYRYLKEAATPFHQALKLLSSGGSEEKVLGLVRHAKDNCHPYFLTDWGRYFKLVGELANLDLYHQSKDLFGQENYDTYFIWGLAYAGHLELLKQQECREVDGIFGAAARAGRLEVIQAFQEELAQHDGREDFLLDAVMIATENDRRAVLHYLVKELVPRWIPKPGRQQKLVDSGLEGVAGGTSLKRAKHFLASIPATLYSAELIFRKLQWAPNPEVFYFLLDQVDLAGFDNNFLLYIVLVTRARYTPHYFGAILAKLAQIPDGLSRVDSQRLLDELTYPGFGFEADDPCLAESRAIWKIYFG